MAMNRPARGGRNYSMGERHHKTQLMTGRLMKIPIDPYPFPFHLLPASSRVEGGEGGSRVLLTYCLRKTINPK